MMMTKSHFEEKQSFSRDTVFLTQPEVSEWLKISKSTLYRWVQEGAFPKPVVLGKPEKNGTSRWVEDEIQEWLDNRPREKADA
tara:strand:+ start:32 stop:280 length:249 start_codon:yes stop_codon:yes gene_type:complete